MKAYKVFTDRATGEELAAYSLEGESEGEEQNTKELLAFERGIDSEQITVTIRAAAGPAQNPNQNKST